MPEKANSTPPIYENTAALMEAVLAISHQEGIEEISLEASKYVVAMLAVDSCSFSRLDKEEKTLILFAEYSTVEEPKSEEFLAPFSYANYPQTRHVIEQGIACQLHVDDPEADPAEVALLRKYESRSLLMLPLMAHAEVIGLVEVYDFEESRVFNENEVAFVQLLLNYVGILIERTNLLEHSQKRANALESLHRVGLALTASLDLEDVLLTVLQSALNLSEDALDAHVFLYKDDRLHLGNAIWGDGQSYPHRDVPREGGRTYTVARTGKTIVVEDAFGESNIQQWSKEKPAGAFAALPLKSGEQVVGVMNVAYSMPKKFPPETLKVLEMLADQAALAVKNAQLLDEITNQALTDTLTGIANRRAFELRLEEEVRRSTRYEHEFCLVFMDLDGFKQVNDSFGHPVGDETLKQVTACLQKVTRETDFLARLGGDEFVLLCPETNYPSGKTMAKNLTTSLEACMFSWKKDKNAFHLSMSVGVVNFPEQADSTTNLIQIGDAMLYQNKFENDIR